MKYPASLPQTHQRLLERIIQTLSADPRIVGIGIGGSYVSDTMDKYSDLDLVIAIDPASYPEVMAQRFDIVSSIEGKLAAFTGEHVGEPRLIIALFAPDTVHVDFKFVSLNDAVQRVDDTQVLWERDHKLTQVLAGTEFHYPQPDPQWCEDRFWIWTHYAAIKIGRGEYFEALEFISFIRFFVLGPLALKQAGLTPSGVRSIETRLPHFADKLQATVATPDKASLTAAFSRCIELYLELRAKEAVEINHEAEAASREYFRRELS